MDRKEILEHLRPIIQEWLVCEAVNRIYCEQISPAEMESVSKLLFSDFIQFCFGEEAFDYLKEYDCPHFDSDIKDFIKC